MIRPARFDNYNALIWCRSDRGQWQRAIYIAGTVVELVDDTWLGENDGERTKARTVTGKCDKSKLLGMKADLKAGATEGGRNREEEGKKGD